VEPRELNKRLRSRSERWVREQGRRPSTLALRRLIDRAGLAVMTLVVKIRMARRTDRVRHVAFVGHNVLMIHTVLRAWGTVADDSRLKARLVVPTSFRRAGKRLARDAGLRCTSGMTWSRLWAWDLVVVATHVKPHHPQVPVVRMLHGVGASSKLLHGHEFTYDPRRVLRPDGTPAYARIFEASELTAADVVRRFPALAGVITVTGSIAADQMLAMQRARADLRLQMGYAPSDRVIVCMSTFGPYSLMETVGRRLIDEMHRISADGGCRFIVCSHPNLWAANRHAARPWDGFLRRQRQHGLTILEPGDDWARAFAVADAAISDHTSLATAFALLGKPLSDPAALPSFLNAMLEGGASARAVAIAEEIVSHRGEAAARTRTELYRLLELEAPADTDLAAAMEPSR
jgi:hypothetical protein